MIISRRRKKFYEMYLDMKMSQSREEGFSEGHSRGHEEGRQDALWTVYHNCLKEGIGKDTAQKIIGLSEDELYSGTISSSVDTFDGRNSHG